MQGSSQQCIETPIGRNDDNVNFKKDEIKCEIEHSPLIVDETKATNIKIVISDTVPNLGVEGTTEVLLTPLPRVTPAPDD